MIYLERFQINWKKSEMFDNDESVKNNLSIELRSRNASDFCSVNSRSGVQLHPRGIWLNLS